MTGEQICRELEQMHARGAGPGELLETALRLLYDSRPEFQWTGVYRITPGGGLRLGPFVAAAGEADSLFVGRGQCVNGDGRRPPEGRLIRDPSTGSLVVESDSRGGEPFMIFLPETAEEVQDQAGAVGSAPPGQGRSVDDPPCEWLRMLGCLTPHDVVPERTVTEWRRSSGRVELVVVDAIAPQSLNHEPPDRPGRRRPR